MVRRDKDPFLALELNPSALGKHLSNLKKQEPMRFRRLSTGAWKISPCNTYLPAAPGYVMVESRQLARLKAERQKNHQLKVRMSDSIKQNSQFSLPLNFAPTTGTTACEAIHWTPSMDTLPRPALAPPPSPATTPSPATAPAETPGPVSAMSVSYPFRRPPQHRHRVRRQRTRAWLTGPQRVDRSSEGA